MGIFIHHSSDSLACGVDFLRILCLGGPFSACAYAFISFFQATGEGMRSFILAILRKGILDIPLMFAALLLISLAGIALFGVMSWVSRRALSAWHESEAVQSH